MTSFRFSSPCVRAALAVACVLVLWTLPASAETTNCTSITTLPYTISSPGAYCLKSNLWVNLASGSAISIAANDVVLDLNGYTLTNSNEGMGNVANGIAGHNVGGVTIRNGTIRFFYRGVFLTDDDFGSTGFGASQHHVVEGMRFDNNRKVGVWVTGLGHTIRNNQVHWTGGTTAKGANVYAHSIIVFGSNHRVIDNDIVHPYGQGTGNGTGIYVYVESGEANALVVGNRITFADLGVFFDGSAGGKYRDNLTSGVTTPYIGGIDAGGNN